VHLPGALQQVAYKLLSPPPGTLLTVEKTHDHPRPHAGTDFQRYRVLDRAGSELGTFIRMRVHHGSATALDVALQVQEGRIARVVPIRPVVLSGAPILDFDDVCAVLKVAPPRDYARPLSRLFRALSDIERAASAPPDRSLTDEQVSRIVTLMKASRPPRPPGSPVPEFDATDESGARFTRERLAGRTSLVVFASLLNPVGRRVLAWVQRYAAGRPGRYAVFEVILNRKPAIEQYRRRGGTFAGVVVPDAGLKVYGSFNPAFSPCMYAYGADGRLILELAPPFSTYEEMADRLDAAR
jgi:hypothetical protein